MIPDQNPAPGDARPVQPTVGRPPRAERPTTASRASTRRIVATAALACVALAACGDDSTSASPAADPPDAPSAVTGPASSEPATDVPATDVPDRVITVTHVYGETVVPARPERIVSLDLQWTDVLTALGHPPVAAALDPYQGDWYPWQTAHGIEPITVGDDYSVPYETVAAFTPDLIVGSWSIADEAAYDTLSAIAPTIATLGERDVDPWEDMAAVAGEILGRTAAAEALVAEGDALAADLRAELPGLAGKTYALVNYVPGDQIYVVADPDDGAAQLFAKLGMQIDPELLALDDGGLGRVELSFERISELDSDLLMLLTNGADPSEIVGFDALPAVQSGASVVLEYAPVVGFNTPTPLSIPYSLDFIRDALEAAAG